MSVRLYYLSISAILALTVGIAGWSLLRTPTEAADDVLWDVVKTSGNAEMLTVFLGKHPDSPHRLEATKLLRSLLIEQTVTRAAPDLTSVVATVPADLLTPPKDNTITHGLRLTSKTLPQLLGLSPKFPPVENLPETLWKAQSCKNCHKWTPPALCDQARTYTEAHFDPRTEKQHPLGVPFKLTLRQWALDGCK